MDRGRMIDHVQNVNAMQIDSFRKTGKTSTRIIHPPGGEDHWNLAWGFEDPEPPKPKVNNKKIDQFKTTFELQQEQNYPNQMKNRNVVESSEFRDAMYNEPEDRFPKNNNMRNNRNVNDSPKNIIYNQNEQRIPKNIRNNRNVNESPELRQIMYNQNEQRNSKNIRNYRNVNESPELRQEMYNQNEQRNFISNSKYKPVEPIENENKNIVTRKVFNSLQVFNKDDGNKESEVKQKKGFVATFNMC